MTQVLSGVSLSLPRGEVLAVLGRNGVGKTTLLAALMGRATRRAGTIRFHGRPFEAVPVYDRAKAGLGFVPQEREVFASLSVAENLLVAARRPPGTSGGWTLDRVVALFPRLGERLRNRGDQLSGGEQQMLSIGRALMGNPSVLLLDEPMEGLAPVIVDQLLAALHRLRAEGEMAILLVEQHLELALAFTHRIVVLDRGAIAYDHADGAGPPDRARIDGLIGVAAAGCAQ